jgi:hypothetical protein
MAHAHDVDAGDALANVGVDALEIVENGFLPVRPIFFEKQAAILGGVAFGERPVKGPDGFVDERADGLVCGVDVAEGGRVEEDSVPGKLGAARIGEVVEREIGGEPGGISEIAERLEIFDEVGGEESWRGEDYEIGFELGVGGGDGETAFG